MRYVAGLSLALLAGSVAADSLKDLMAPEVGKPLRIFNARNDFRDVTVSRVGADYFCAKTTATDNAGKPFEWEKCWPFSSVVSYNPPQSNNIGPQPAFVSVSGSGF